MSDKIAVCVPFYRDKLNPAEELAVEHLCRFLPNERKILIIPEDLRLNRTDFEIVRFPARFFRNVLSYNRLLLSRRFYRAFRRYEWILIYQLDSLVLSDQLHRWIGNVDFDFIGAPVFDDAGQMIGLNGGVFLRPVRALFCVLLRGKGVAGEIAAKIPFMERNTATRTIKRLLINLHLTGVVNAAPVLV